MVCSMWQIIRHANQVEAAVQSLIMVPVPHKGTSPPCTTPQIPSRLMQPPPPTHINPHSLAALVHPDRQMDQRLKHWYESRFRQNWPSCFFSHQLSTRIIEFCVNMTFPYLAWHYVLVFLLTCFSQIHSKNSVKTFSI